MLIDQVSEVLLIDGDKDDALFFRRAIRELNSGIRCHLAPDAAVLYKQETTEINPDIIFLNTVPPASGLEHLKRIKSNASTRHIPVVIYTSLSNPQIIQDARDQGAAAFVIKPYRLDDIKKELRAAIEHI